jgi:hypothetical protein
MQAYFMFRVLYVIHFISFFIHIINNNYNLSITVKTSIIMQFTDMHLDTTTYIGCYYN